MCLRLLIAQPYQRTKDSRNIRINNWPKENKITFNEQKSKVMLATRRKSEEITEVNVYLNSKPLQQAKSIKYLGISIDTKLNFREHIISTKNKCTQLIHTFAKSAKLNWGLKQEALNTIYKGAILSLLLYGAPVWVRAMEKNYNRTLYSRVKRVMNIKIDKATVLPPMTNSTS